MSELETIAPETTENIATSVDAEPQNAPTAAGSTASPPDVSQVESKRVFIGNLSYGTSWQSLKDHCRQAGNPIHADIFGRSGSGLVEFETVEEAKRAIQMLHDTVLDGRQIFVREDREGGMSGGTGANGMGGGRGGGVGGRGGGGFRPGGPPRRRGGYNNTSGAGAAMSSDAPVAGAPVTTGTGTPALSSPPAMSGGGALTGGGGKYRESDKGRKIAVYNLPYKIRWQDLKDLFRSCGNIIRADVITDQAGRSKGVGTIVFETEAEAQNAIAKMSGTDVGGREIEVKLDKYA